jgi:hypothetical protein
MSSNKSALMVAIAFYGSVWPACAVTTTSSAFSIDRIVKERGFGPQLPLESDLVRKYGEGCVKQLYREERLRTYFDASTGLWWRCRIQANETAMQPCSEILASSLPLCGEKISPKARIGVRSLNGVRIGNSFQRIVMVFGRPSRSNKVSLNGVNTERHDYIGSSPERGTVVTFYVRNKVVVGFSISTPE